MQVQRYSRPTLVAASAVFLASLVGTSVAVAETSKVIGQLTASGPVIIGAGNAALGISDDVTPYFQGDRILTKGESEALVRFAQSTGYFVTLPDTSARGHRADSGAYLIYGTGTGLTFSFPADAQFAVKFGCLTVKNGSKSAPNAASTSIEGKVAAVDGAIHIYSQRGRLVVKNNQETEYLVKQGEEVSSCQATQVASVSGTSSPSVAVAKKAASGVPAATLGAFAVAATAIGGSSESGANFARSKPDTAPQRQARDDNKIGNKVASNNGTANSQRSTRVVRVASRGNAIKVANNGSADSYAFGRGKSKSKVKWRHHRNCFGGAASPVAGGKHNRCGKKKHKHRRKH